MNFLGRVEPEEMLADLVHELRQPLGTIEYSTCYLQMLLGETPQAIQEQFTIIQQQIDHACRLMSDVIARFPAPRVQRTVTEASLDLTNPETAAVT